MEDVRYDVSRTDVSVSLEQVSQKTEDRSERAVSDV